MNRQRTNLYLFYSLVLRDVVTAIWHPYLEVHWFVHDRSDPRKIPVKDKHKLPQFSVVAGIFLSESQIYSQSSVGEPYIPKQEAKGTLDQIKPCQIVNFHPTCNLCGLYYWV
jgi:hypothetical protein